YVFCRKFLKKDSLWSLRALYWVSLILGGFFLILKLGSFPDFERTVPHSSQLIFVVWIVLILLPFFSEFSIFGFKFKKELERTEKKIDARLKTFELHLQSLTYVSNE